MKLTNLQNNIDRLDKISQNLANVIVKSFDYANLRGGTKINAEDLFLAIINNPESMAAKILEKLGVDILLTSQQMVQKYNGSVLDPNLQIVFGEEAKRILASAFLIASEMGHVYVGTEHLLLAILRLQDYLFVKDLAENGLNFEYMKQAIQGFGIYQPGIFSKPVDPNTENEDEQQNSNLSFFSRDMNKLAEDGKYLKVWGREQEIQRIIHILSRRTKNNVLLVGEAGVGKTAIVEGFVQRIIAGNVPGLFKDKRIMQLDISSILAGSKIRGDVEERLLGIINEAANDPDLILFIDEIHMIVGAGAAGGNGNMDIANILKPYLTNGDLRIIGATTFDEYQKYFEEDDALARRFQTLTVNEINVEDAAKVIEMLRPQFENYHNVRIPSDVIIEAVDLSNRYITNKYLPDKAIDVIDEAAAAKKIEIQAKDIKPDKYDIELSQIMNEKDKALEDGDIILASALRKKESELMRKIEQSESKKEAKISAKAIVSKEDVRKVISKWSNVPITSMKSNDLRNIQALDVSLMKRIVGQDKAISAISGALKRARIGLSDSKRPMASFIFLGPTGVGKTETAKEIARNMFGSEKLLIQVDMSEYMEAHSVSKLIGSPPGYIGYQEGGQLTEKIRRQPYSVVLFDEIEKAHPDLVNILLQILDEGRVQDARGRMVNFKNTVIIMTSNIGAQEVNNDAILGFGVDSKSTETSEQENAYLKLEESIISELKLTLPPEFLNRIDNTIIFRGLDEEDAYKISKILLNELNERITKKGVQLLPTTSVMRLIANQGFDKEFGARNIKRKIQELIENPLADYLIEHNLVNEDARDLVKIKLDKDRNKVTFKKY